MKQLGDAAAESTFAHTPDTCFVRYSPDGKYLYTAGQEGHVIAYPTDQPLAFSSLKKRFHRGAILGLDVRDDRVATVGADCAAVLYGAAPDKLNEALLATRQSLSMRAVAFSPDGRFLAASGEALAIVLVDLRVPNGPCAVFEEHQRPVSCLAYDPSGTRLASIDLGGKLCVWEMNGTGMIRLDSSEIPVKSWPRLAWSPDGQLLAVAARSEIRLIQRDTWTAWKYLACDAPATGLQWSQDGSFLVSFDEAKVQFWHLKEGRPQLSAEKGQGSILVACLAPNMRDLVFIDGNGDMFRQLDFLSADDLAALQKGRPVFDKPAKPKRSKNDLKALEKKYTLQDAEDEDDEGIDLDNTSGGESEEEEEEDEFESVGDYGIDDQHQLDEHFGEDEAPVATETETTGRTTHPSFQPGATSDPLHRYLAWNLVGLITSRKDEAGYQSIDIEFHDKLSTRPIRFIDDYGFTMAALCRTGALFASPATDAALSTIHYMVFETWQGRQTWTVQLEEGETVCGVALTDTTAFVATSHGWLRTFTAAGIQRPIYTHGHQLVTMVAGADKLLLVLDNHRSLQTQLYSCSSKDGLALVFDGPLGGRADTNRLLWAGINDTGLVGCVDQTGILYVLADRLGFCWTPFGDFSAQMRNGLVWPIFFDRQELTCIQCKPDEAHPPVLPRPIMTNLPIRLPLVQPDDPQVQLYEPVLRTAVLDKLVLHGQAGMREKDIRKANTASDKLVLELIQMAIKAEKHVRALELCGLFYSEKSFELAVQLARHHRLVSLADKMDLARDDFLKRKAEGEESRPEVLSTPKLPLKVQHQSPSTILANLTPGDKPHLRANLEEVEDSPSLQRKRPKMDLVAAATDDLDVMMVEEEHAEEAPLAPTMIQAEVVATPEKKPRGLMDMLSRLSSMVTTSPMKTTETKPKAAPEKTKENVEQPQAKGLKQASLSSIFKKTSPTAPETDQQAAEPMQQD